MYYAGGCGKIEMPHNSIPDNRRECVFAYWQKRTLHLGILYDCQELCGNNRGCAFFGGTASAVPLFCYQFLEVERMKRTIAILLALLMVLSLTACGGGNKDKDKLIGVWTWDIPYEKTYNPGTDSYISIEAKQTYSFFENNEFYFLWYGGMDMWTGSRVPRDKWTKRLYHGTYSMKDGILTLKYDNDEKEEQKIPYYINEYTKGLMLDVNEKGESDWYHSSETPRVLTTD